jgi:glutamate:GABA antiporter
VSAYDGAFIPWFGVFNRRFGTPVRVNVMSGIASSLFCIVAIAAFNSGSDATFQVVLDIAISTTLISYILMFPAVLKLRYSYPDVHRPYVHPFGMVGIWVSTVLVTGFILLGSWVAVFPGTIEKIVGVDYGSFKDSWGVTRGRFEAVTLGTLAVIIALGVVGYALGKAVREQVVDVPLEPALGD